MAIEEVGETKDRKGIKGREERGRGERGRGERGRGERGRGERKGREES